MFCACTFLQLQSKQKAVREELSIIWQHWVPAVLFKMVEPFTTLQHKSLYCSTTSVLYKIIKFFRATHVHVVCNIIGHIRLFINQGTMAKHASTEFSRLNLVIYAMGVCGFDIYITQQ